MGDYRTLHLFDKTKYLNEVVPVVRNLKSFLPMFLNEERTRWLDGFSNPVDKNLSETIKIETIKFVSELDEELKKHPELTELSRLRQIPDRKDDNYFSLRENFYKRTQAGSREFFEYLMMQTIFSDTGHFYPYFTLGKYMFESNIEAKNNSIAETLILKITTHEEGQVLDSGDDGIINWLGKEEVDLLYSDRDNVLGNKEAYEYDVDYVVQFKEFLRIAVENKLGIISLRNPMEADLSQLKNSFDDITIKFQKPTNFTYVVTRKAIQ